jgi:CheY-like chemotaxis protein
MEEFQDVDILLVEDSALDAELTMRGLKDEKLANRITWLKSGEEALDYVFRRGNFAGRNDSGPKMILLDLKMPGIGGIEVTKEIKGNEATRRIPIVIMTSSREEKDIIDTYNLGANSYIVKPLNFESLAEVARQIGFYWLAINHSAG